MWATQNVEPCCRQQFALAHLFSRCTARVGTYRYCNCNGTKLKSGTGIPSVFNQVFYLFVIPTCHLCFVEWPTKVLIVCSLLKQYARKHKPLKTQNGLEVFLRRNTSIGEWAETSHRLTGSDLSGIRNGACVQVDSREDTTAKCLTNIKSYPYKPGLPSKLQLNA